MEVSKQEKMMGAPDPWHQQAHGCIASLCQSSTYFADSLQALQMAVCTDTRASDSSGSQLWVRF